MTRRLRNFNLSIPKFYFEYLNIVLGEVIYIYEDLNSMIPQVMRTIFYRKNFTHSR